LQRKSNLKKVCCILDLMVCSQRIYGNTQICLQFTVEAPVPDVEELTSTPDDLETGQNRLSLVIRSARIDVHKLLFAKPSLKRLRNLKTFVSFDFADFETCMTRPISSFDPVYDATYK
jgi:hypothetical protein